MASSDDYVEDQLAPIAEHIARRRAGEVDLLWMKGPSFTWDAAFTNMITEVLAREVERLTSGEFTVRRLNPVASKTTAMSQTIYLVRCPTDTPEGIVQYPTENMDLVLVGPYKGGYQFGVDMLREREEIDQLQAERAARDEEVRLERTKREAIDVAVDAQVTQIHQALEHFLDRQTDEWAKQRAEQLMWSDPKRIPLDKLLELCILLGVTLEQLENYQP